MSTIYAFHVNAPAQTAVADTDAMLIYDATLKKTSQITPKALNASMGGVVNTTATTLTITQALHSNRVVTISSAAAIAITLPQATGTGNKYRFVMSVAATATSHTIKVANATDVMQGVVLALTTSSDNVIGYGTSATSDTITLNGTTLGGVVGDEFEITDIKTGFFQVKGVTSPTGSTATPFSAAVA